MIIAYATKGRYEKIANKRLVASLKRLKLKYDLEIIESRGKWIDNCHYRAGFILRKFEQYPKHPLLSIDADAVVHKNPLKYFKRLKCDIAAHYLDKHKLRKNWSGLELLPGTLWLRPTEKTIKMVERWKEIAEANPKKPDRFCCRGAVKWAKRELGLVVENLPPQYTYIFDTSKKAYPGVKPIIEHHQASRKVRRVIKLKNKRKKK